MIEGADCLAWSGLTADLVHSADAGHARIGAQIAARLAPHLPE